MGWENVNITVLTGTEKKLRGNTEEAQRNCWKT